MLLFVPMDPMRKIFCVALLILVGLSPGCKTRSGIPPSAPSPHPAPSLPAAFPFSSDSAPHIAIIKATVSAGSVADQSYAKSLSSRIAQWITQNGVPVKTLSDNEVIAGGLRGFPIAILAYSPHPTPALLTALKRHRKAGGKLIVFYGTDPTLATLMGVRLDRFRQAPPLAPWSGWTFIDNAPVGGPRQVEQFSANIFTVLPAHPQSRIIARWNTAPGQIDSQPAWLKTPGGFWMTHILQDGDGAAKSRMLLAFCGELDPAVWRQAAEASLLQTRLLATRPRDSETLRALEAMERAANAGQYPEVVREGRRLQETLLIRHALAQKPRQPEFRGVWNHSGTGLYPGDWNRTADILAKSGFQAIFPYCGSPAETLYAAPPRASADAYRKYGDQLDQALRAGHKHGLEVHAWIICWRMETAPSAVRDSLRRQGRLQVSDTGERLDWLCPSHPDNQNLMRAQIRDIAKRYPVDGIHLDYIRYKDSHYCYCAGCRSRFEVAIGRPIRQWPAEVRSGPLQVRYSAWRCEQINNLVAAVYRDVKGIRKDLKVSAAVWGYYPLCIKSIGQDWGAWLRRGDLDFACPMNYTADTHQFTRWLKTQTALPDAAGKIMAGLGVTAMESRLSPAQTIAQIQILRQEGASGFLLFDLNSTLEREILPYLRMGITAP
jgi:uncharacterized lipoprotein YddW (UPF0748 family)